MSDETALAARVYARYAELIGYSPEGLGGSLLLALLPAEPARAPQVTTLVRAANIAGAATLLVAPDAQVGREQVRSGVCDFLVTTLDEALRVLKNEIRRRRQVAVVLSHDPASPASVVRACVERGVQPDWLLAPADADLVRRGARVVASECAPCSAAEIVWWIANASAAPILERLASAVVTAGSGDQGREAASGKLRWLARAPQYLGRELSRVHTVPLSEDETARFCSAIHEARATGRIGDEVSVWRGEVELVSRGTATV